MMIEPQMIAFFALTGLMGHALFMAVRGDDAPAQPTVDEPGLFWTSARFNQGGDGQERPLFLD